MLFPESKDVKKHGLLHWSDLNNNPICLLNNLSISISRGATFACCCLGLGRERIQLGCVRTKEVCDMLLEPCERGHRLVPFLHEAWQAGYLCAFSKISINSRYNVWR